MRTKQLLLTLLATLILIMGIASPIAAHGDGEQLELYRVPVSGYYVSVWSLPGVLRTGEVHFETAVFDQDFRPVTDCDIKLLLTPINNPAKAVQLQTRKPTAETYFRHETELDILKAEQFNITVLLTDPAGNQGQTEFQVEVIDIPLWLKLPIYTGITVATLAALFLMQKGLTLFGIWKPQATVVETVRRPSRQK